MKDERKTKKQLVDELAVLRQQLVELQAARDQEEDTQGVHHAAQLATFPGNGAGRSTVDPIA